jgi:hypothetical protein
MRVLVATLVAGALVASGTTATAKPAPPKPDLVTSDVVPVLTGSTVAVYATITNKGKEKAKASTAAFHLSTNTTLDSADVLLGSAAVRKLKPKKAKTIYPFLTVPSTVAPGAYYVIVCADSEGKVKEKKEGNNCAASASPVTVGGSVTPPPPPGTYNVTVNPYLGWVAISINGDTPSTSSRTVVFPQGSQVILTVTPQSGYTWAGDWQPPETCDGAKAGAGSQFSMTFSSLSHNVNCVANSTVTP